MPCRSKNSDLVACPLFQFPISIESIILLSFTKSEPKFCAGERKSCLNLATDFAKKWQILQKNRISEGLVALISCPCCWRFRTKFSMRIRINSGQFHHWLKIDVGRVIWFTRWGFISDVVRGLMVRERGINLWVEHYVINCDCIIVAPPYLHIYLPIMSVILTRTNFIQ